MNRNQGWLILIGSALLALPFAVWSQTGSTTTTDTKTTPESTDRLIQKYTAFAGSEDNAKSLVTGLRSGTEVKLSSGSTSTSFTSPTGKMGFGNVNIALSLADASLKQQGITNPTPQQLQSSLTGILDQRASGKGWGQIANSMGFKPGEVVRSEKAGQAGMEQRAENARAERPERPLRPEKPERPARR